jgi:methionyl aminopeptidase
MSPSHKIIIKNKEQIEHIRIAGKYLTEMLLLLKDAIEPGIVLLDLEKIAAEYLKKNNIKGTFIGHH